MAKWCKSKAKNQISKMKKKKHVARNKCDLAVRCLFENWPIVYVD